MQKNYKSEQERLQKTILEQEKRVLDFNKSHPKLLKTRSNTPQLAAKRKNSQAPLKKLTSRRPSIKLVPCNSTGQLF